jgi:regulator of protease activity HflC (stomatin/prohibitin superfamily)
MTGITSILNILALLGWAVAAGGIFLAVSATSRRTSARPGILLAIVGVIVGLVFAIVGAGLVIIEPQETGVVFRSIGGDEDSIVDTPLGPGVNWVIPFVDQITIYPTTRQSVTLAATEGGGLAPIAARTNDGQEVTIDVTVIFRITEASVNQIYRDWRTGYIEGTVIPFTREVVRNEISKLSVEEVYGQRETLGPDIVAALRPRLGNEGLELIELAVRNITFSAEFVDAVERKQIAEQDVQRSQNEAEAARKAAEGERDANILRAEGERDADIERAKGEAEAIRLRAEADAEALALINEQISQNPALVQWRYIEQLGDNVALVIIPSNSPFLFDLESMAAQTGTSLQVVPTPEPAETGSE